MDAFLISPGDVYFAAVANYISPDTYFIAQLASISDGAEPSSSPSFQIAYSFLRLASLVSSLLAASNIAWYTALRNSSGVCAAFTEASCRDVKMSS